MEKERLFLCLSKFCHLLSGLLKEFGQILTGQIPLLCGRPFRCKRSWEPAVWRRAARAPTRPCWIGLLISPRAEREAQAAPGVPLNLVTLWKCSGKVVWILCIFHFFLLAIGVFCFESCFFFFSLSEGSCFLPSVLFHSCSVAEELLFWGREREGKQMWSYEWGRGHIFLCSCNSRIKREKKTCLHTCSELSFHVLKLVSLMSVSRGASRT